MWPTAMLREIRLAELERVLLYFPPGCRVLEIGAGAGWQAYELNRRGYEVEAIEYAHPGFQALANNRVWPIHNYDGHQIPFEDDSFDVVFSSNVLEHVPHVRVFQHEIRRVLKPDGLAIHLMPTATWRLWSTLAHYAFAGQRLCGGFVRKAQGNSKDGQDAAAPREAGGISRRSRLQKIAWFLIPERHGEVGNFVTEMVHFSRWRWRSVFRSSGFQIDVEGSNGIFYSGYAVFGATMPLRTRERLAAILGSSCRFWVLSQQTDGRSD